MALFIMYLGLYRILVMLDSKYIIFVIAVYSVSLNTPALLLTF